jgi:hypothetical protein
MRKLVILLAVCIFATFAAGSAAFAGDLRFYKDWRDIPDWAAKVLKFQDGTPRGIVGDFPDAVKWEIYTGYPDWTLKPNNTITRAEFAAALSRVLDVSGEPGDQWYTAAVNGLVDAGVVPNWDGDWDAPITRLEMGQWMGRAAVAGKVPFTKSASFSDTSDPDVLNAAKAGVIGGFPDGTYGPKKTATRLEAALMLVRLARGMNDGAPAEEEMRKVEETEAAKEQEAMIKAHENQKWDNSILKGYVTEKSALEIQTICAAGGYRMPWPYRLKEFEVLEAHKNICRVRTRYEFDLGNKNNWVADGNSVNYYKKIDGRWVNTHAEPLY